MFKIHSIFNCFFFYLSHFVLGLLLTEGAHSLQTVTSAQVGENVTFNCVLSESSTHLFWYKYSVGLKLELMGYFDRQKKLRRKVFKPERSSIQIINQSFQLTVAQVEESDEAMYICALNEPNNFTSGSYLIVHGNLMYSLSVIQTPLTRGVRSGDSVTLQCTVLQESSSQDFRVFWFRPTSGEFHPASIYTEITSGDHCEILSGTSSCIYEFTKDKLGLSDAGMYCCAVATCGKIIFGNGTKLELLVSGLFLLIIYVTYTCLAGGHHNQEGASPRARHGVTNDTNADILNYAAVHISKKKRRERRKRDLPEDVVYSDVKYSTNVQ
uniref:Ig-like domain-containing protein n=1 Tax=Denticeps clupeoides TaxID=299321 RepID=A0AAY4ED40_9TELE